MKQIIRSFSIGLIAAGIIMLAVYFISGTTRDTAENLELEDLIPLVENQGHRVITEEEYIMLSVQTANGQKEAGEESEDQSEKTKKDEAVEEDEEIKEDAEDEEDRTEDEEVNDSDEEKEEDREDEPAEYTITVESGMASSQISSILAENNIIEDGAEFTEYLEEHDYSGRIKATEHEVSSDMSFYELAEELVSN